MNKKDFENADCLCHLRPPCNKCMNSCPDCQGYLAEDGEDESCVKCQVKMAKTITRENTIKEVVEHLLKITSPDSEAHRYAKWFGQEIEKREWI
jgi:hypothetical protein